MLESDLVKKKFFLQDLYFQKQHQKRVGWTLKEPNMGLSCTATRGGGKDRFLLGVGQQAVGSSQSWSAPHSETEFVKVANDLYFANTPGSISGPLLAWQPHLTQFDALSSLNLSLLLDSGSPPSPLADFPQSPLLIPTPLLFPML